MQDVTQAKTLWSGSEDGMPPRDWDGRCVLLRDGRWVDPAYLASTKDGYSAYWRHDGCGEDIVAYRHRLASTAQPEVKGLVEALEEISDLHGEINPSNYDHDDACELNRQFCYAITTAAAALAAYREAQP